MVKISTKRGLNIPVGGPASTDIEEIPQTGTIALDLSPFSDKARLKASVKECDKVQIGQVLAHDAHNCDRIFTSPAGGTVEEIVRGEKRRILSIVIRCEMPEEMAYLDPLKESATKEEIVQALFRSGASPYLFSRPFKRLIQQDKLPRAIFVSAVASAPLSSPMKIQMQGEEENFQRGLTLLSKIATCHLVSDDKLFDGFKDVTHHRAIGKHPIDSHSLHIERISPIQGVDDCLWTVDARGVCAIGALLGKGEYPLQRIVAVTGTGFQPTIRKHFKVRVGSQINPIVESGIEPKIDRIVSGNLLDGNSTSLHLGFFDTQISGLLSPPRRKVMPFATLGLSRYTSFRTYLSKLRFAKKFHFSANLMGEERPMVDATLYDRVMPLSLPVEPFIKALMAKDYEMALELGLLDVVPEDFALCEFVCPSKIPFTKIVKQGIEEYLELYGS